MMVRRSIILLNASSRPKRQCWSEPLHRLTSHTGEKMTLIVRSPPSLYQEMKTLSFLGSDRGGPDVVSKPDEEGK